MTDTHESDKENLSWANIPAVQLTPKDQSKRCSSLLFVANVDDSPGSEDEEITFKPSKRHLAGRKAEQSLEGIAPHEHTPDVAQADHDDRSTEASEEPTSVNDLTNSVSRFEQVSAKLDEWKRTMAGFSSSPVALENAQPELESSLPSEELHPNSSSVVRLLFLPLSFFPLPLFKSTIQLFLKTVVFTGRKPAG